MKKIFFLHGLNWSVACPMAVTLREELRGVAEVVAPDLSVDPEVALAAVREICREVKTDLIVGSSYGSFLGQQVVGEVGCRALLCSPMFQMAEFLQTRIGWHEFKSPRRDGAIGYEVTPELIEKYRRTEVHQFDGYNPAMRDRVIGFYGSQDTLARTRQEFLRYYSTVIDYDGPHTMTPENVRSVLAPAAIRILKSNAI